MEDPGQTKSGKQNRQRDPPSFDGDESSRRNVGEDRRTVVLSLIRIIRASQEKSHRWVTECLTVARLGAAGRHQRICTRRQILAGLHLGHRVLAILSDTTEKRDLRHCVRRDLLGTIVLLILLWFCTPRLLLRTRWILRPQCWSRVSGLSTCCQVWQPQRVCSASERTFLRTEMSCA